MFNDLSAYIAPAVATKSATDSVDSNCVYLLIILVFYKLILCVFCGFCVRYLFPRAVSFSHTEFTEYTELPVLVCMLTLSLESTELL